MKLFFLCREIVEMPLENGISRDAEMEPQQDRHQAALIKLISPKPNM